MFTPTIEQLEELGFKKETKYCIDQEWIEYVLYGDYEIECSLYDKNSPSFSLDFGDGFINIYPESIEDLQTIIKCFRIK